MEPAVTPELALRYLRELSADLLAAAVTTAGGVVLAGPADLGAAGTALLAASADAGPHVAVHARVGSALVVAARSPEHAVIAVHTEHALAGLVRHDLLTVLGDLATQSGPVPEDVAPRPAVADDAVRHAVERVRTVHDGKP